MARISDSKRAAIVDDIKAGTKSRNQIARDHAVSVGSVTNIARENDLTDAFDRSATARATELLIVDLKAKRAQLKADLLDDAQRLRERAWSQYSYYERGKDEPVRVTLDLPPLGDVRNAYTSIAICVDKHGLLDRHDGDSGSEGARNMLTALADGLQVAADQINGTTSQ